MADHPSKNNFRWIRFTGDSVSRWANIIDEVELKQIPVELIDSVKFISRDGTELSIKIVDLLKNRDEDHVGDIIDQAIESRKEDLRAVEFLLDFDKLESTIVSAIGKLFEHT